MGLAGLSVALVLFKLWESVRRLAVASDGSAGRAHELDDRQALQSEKETLLRTIKDLEFERDVGKLSEADFESLNRRARGRAREVLQALDDQVASYRDRAQALIDKELEQLGDPKAVSKQKAKADEGPSGSATSSEDGAAKPSGADQGARLDCPDCGVDNEADAVFCKKCGHKLGGADA